MVNPISTTGGVTTATASEGTGAAQKAALDKDAFLKLLVAQLSHQDPLQPTEGTEFVAQLSQFAMVEQAIAQSSKLEFLSAQMRGLANNEVAGLVGKSVTVRGNGIAYDGVSATATSAVLEAPAASVKVSVVDANGRTVRTIDVGARPAGALPVSWDGRGDDGQKLPAGTYDVKIDAKGPSGASVGVSQDVTGNVVRVSFDKGYPELVLESGVTAPVSDLVSVGGKIG